LRTSLLPQVEQIVLEAHRAQYEAEGRDWSRPIAYRWLRYEDPMPVARLRDGVRKLQRKGASFSAQAVDNVCVEASRSGYLN
jgi:hypothetical protein